MFKNSKAFSSFSVDDLQKAKEFYGQTLGFDITEDPHMPELLQLHLSTDAIIMIYPKGDAHTPATFTVLNFPVENIDSAVDALTKKGVQIEKYEGMIQKDEKGIARGMVQALHGLKTPREIFSLFFRRNNITT